MTSIEVVGGKVLMELINNYYHDNPSPYYLNANIHSLFRNKEDQFFVTNEDIIEHVKKLLSDKYTLQVEDVQRILKSQDPDGEDFPFPDVKLKITLK